MKHDIDSQYLSDLRREILASFSIDELKTLCADLGVAYEDISGETRESKARELVSYFDRRGQLPRLVAYCASARPNASWPLRSNAGSFPAPGPSKPPQNSETATFSMAVGPTDLSSLLPPRGAGVHGDITANLTIRPKPVTSPITIEQPIRMEFVRVPAGSFLMGSDPRRDKEARDDELPQHQVDLPEFFIGKCPVTNEQYAAFVKVTRYQKPLGWRTGQVPAGKENHPVVYVSWHDAVAFCQWLSETTGLTLRLPTEAEWEKAARGTDGRIYPWGDESPDARRCNFAKNMGETSSVVSCPEGVSPCDALDTAGNVWEWCSDWYSETAYRSRKGRVTRSPTGPGQGIFQTLRGGSWCDDGNAVRCGCRGMSLPGDRTDSIGFRVARSSLK